MGARARLGVAVSGCEHHQVCVTYAAVGQAMHAVEKGYGRLTAAAMIVEGAGRAASLLVDPDFVRMVLFEQFVQFSGDDPAEARARFDLLLVDRHHVLARAAVRDEGTGRELCAAIAGDGA